MTTTRWCAGSPSALPKADAVVFEKDGETLGIAPWDDVKKKLPGALRPAAGYPTRFMAHDFPEDWRLAVLDLKPWGADTP
jgi:hypothetical protein